MRVLSIAPHPLLEIPCVNVASGGLFVEKRHIPVLQGIVDTLPQPLEALLITSDLQGYDSQLKPVEERRLLGFLLVEEIQKLARQGYLPPLEKIGVLLAGDLYAFPELHRRGGLGDVQDIWLAFANNFRWVSGVAGNHDQFQGKCGFGSTFKKQSNIYPLDSQFASVDTLKLTGISGILGNRWRGWNHSIKQFQENCQTLFAHHPDILMLHEGPSLPELALKGSIEVREVLCGFSSSCLVVCGHRHWKTPLAQLPNGMQILNVDSRVLLLTRDSISLFSRKTNKERALKETSPNL